MTTPNFTLVTPGMVNVPDTGTACQAPPKKEKVPEPEDLKAVVQDIKKQEERLSEVVQDIQSGGHHIIIHSKEDMKEALKEAESKNWESQLIEPIIEYEFKETLWDASFFLFERRTELAPNIALLILLLIYIGSQVIFMGILYKFFMEPEFGPETVEEMKMWRVKVGQSEFWVDPADTGLSLSARVCALDGSVGAESDKVDLLRNIKQYWDWENPGPLFSGPALALVCMIAWAMTCFGEIRSILKCAYLLLTTPRGETLLAGNQEHGFSLMRMSTTRFIWIASLLTIQMVIAVSILIAGLIFISSTTKIETLLLHALAMEIIFTIDERLFEALCPATMQNLVKCMKPLEKRSPSWKGLDVISVFMGISSFAVIIAVFCTATWQTFGAVKDVQQALCQGHTNFYYGGDQTGLLWAVEPSRQKMYTSAEAVVDLFKEGGGHEYPFSVGSFTQMTNKMSNFRSEELQVQELSKDPTENVTTCFDLISSKNFSHQHIAAAVTKYGPTLGEERIKDCEEVKELCSTEILIRTICPHTCGCDDPVGGVFISDSSNAGCPSRSCSQSDFHIKQMNTVPCIDSNGTSPWDDWSIEFEQLLLSTPAPLGFEWPCQSTVKGNCSSFFSSSKCDIITRWSEWSAELPFILTSSIDTCFTGTWSDALSLTPLATLCPQTCGCNATTTITNPTCPRQCQ